MSQEAASSAADSSLPPLPDHLKPPPQPANPMRPAESAPPTPIELKIFDMARARFGERLNKLSYNTVIRFIRGFAHEKPREEKTLQMIENCLKWREELKVDELAREPYGERFKRFQQLWPAGFHGISKQGHPIYVERPGKIDPDKVWSEFKWEEVRNFHIKMMEDLVALKEGITERTGELCYKHVVIMDLEGLGLNIMREKLYGPIKELLHIDQFYYPETLHTMVICNAPWLFKAVWAIVSPWIDPITKSKILWGKDNLEKVMDKDQIPAFLKGGCKCADGKCLQEPFIDGKGNPLPPLRRVPDLPLPGEESKQDAPSADPAGAAAPAATTDASVAAVTEAMAAASVSEAAPASAAENTTQSAEPAPAPSS